MQNFFQFFIEDMAELGRDDKANEYSKLYKKTL